jgi:putative restriction endonuclease
MHVYIAITDYDWFRFLRDRPGLDEVNFWRPGEGARAFRALPPGGLFLFKLRKRFGGAIVGGGWFLHFSRFPSALVWEAFGERNGTASYDELSHRLAGLRRQAIGVGDPDVGCIILTQPFFLPETEWMAPPADWPPNVEGGKTYPLEGAYGAVLLSQLQSRWASRGAVEAELTPVAFAESVGRRRLGQGSFELVVRDAYQRRCAITQERVLPVLQAAHIRPVTKGGPHQLGNGLLLRSDIHTLFDKGYVTVTLDGRVQISRRVHDEFNNGKNYYELDGRRLWVPRRAEDRPSAAFLDWHRNQVFKDAA